MINHIIKALQTEDSIFINELGRFSKQYISACIIGNTIQPPHNEVILDTSNLDHDEMIFTNLVCREEQCRITEASDAIAQ